MPSISMLLRSILLLGVLAAPSAFSGGPIPNPEFELDPDMNAKLLKERARQGTISDGMRHGRGGAPGAQGECGNVNINSNNQPQSNSGIREMFGKQNTTIITGPVINAARCN